MNGGFRGSFRRTTGLCAIAIALVASMTLITSSRANASSALTQGTPTSVAIAPGAGYSGQLTATNEPGGGGSLTWTTTTSSSEVTVSSSGAVTVPTSVTTPGTVTVSGTVADAVGDTGNWSFSLTINTSDEFAWGYGEDGELGNGTENSSSTPVEANLPAGVTATAIAAASSTSYAIGSNGNVYAWGYGPEGELGNNTMTEDQTTPVQVTLPPGVTATAIAAGEDTGYALGSNGSVYAWGYGSDGELGNNTTTEYQTTPVKVLLSLPAGVTVTSLAAAMGTAYALGSNGSVFAWGDGSEGQLGNGTQNSSSTPVQVTLPPGVTFTAIAASSDDGYAIGSDGNVYGWGTAAWSTLGPNATEDFETTPFNLFLFSGTDPPVSEFGGVTAIAAGNIGYGGPDVDGVGGVYAISGGTLYTWGFVPQTRNGTTTSGMEPNPTPVTFPVGVSPTGITAGQGFAYTIGSNGTLYAFGASNNGDLGNGTTTGSPGLQATPVAVSLPAGVVPTALGPEPDSLTGYVVVRPTSTLTQGTPTSVAIAPGAGYSGQLTATNEPGGGGSLTWTTTTSSSEVTVSSSGAVTVPTSVTTPGTVTVSGTVADAVGDTGNWSFSLTINTSDEFAWGYGEDGELGNGTENSSSTPVEANLPAGVTATAIAAASSTSYAIGSNGNVYAWGYGPEGELGNNTMTEDQTTPVQVTLPPGVTATAIAAGEDTGYALGSNGSVYAWGYGSDGELGNNTTTEYQTTPVKVLLSLPAGVTVTSLAAAMGTAYALGSNGSVFAWGDGSEGQLGNGTQNSSSTPVQVTLPPGVTFTAIAASSDDGYAIGSDGNVYGWGTAAWSTLGPNATEDFETTPFNLFLFSGTDPPVSEFGGVTAIAAGNIGYGGPDVDGVGGVYAISGGTLYTWGFVPQTRNGTTTSGMEPNPTPVTFPVGVSPTGITAGQGFAYTIGSNGTLYAFGASNNGDLGNGTTTGSPGLQATPVAVSLPAGVVPTALGPEPDSLTGYVVVRPTAPPTVTSASSTTLTQGQPGTFTITATGTPAATFSETGTLPTGVTLSSTGVLSGTPTQSGSFAITITATNGVSPNSIQSFTLFVDAPPTITSANEGFFEQGHAGSFTVTATGTPAPTFTETGSLPTGVTLSSTGVLSGTTTQTGLFYITITATNGVSPNAIQSFIVVVDAPPTITSANSAIFAMGVADAFTVSETGFPGSAFTEIGTLPTGVTLSSGGVLSGTPTQLGSFPITFTASNGNSPNATQSFTLTVATSTNPVPSDELAWGNGTNGELGNGTTTSTQSTPVPVSLPPGVTATTTAGGSATSYAIGSNGTLYAWGSGTDGQLGNGTTTATQTSAVAVSLPAGVTPTAVAPGELTTYALGSNGTVYAWGYGPDGELGNGTTSDATTTPVAVSLPTGITATAIGAAGYTGYAMGSNGTLYAWGNGADGELGNGTTTDPQTTPVAVSLPTGVTARAITGGEYTAYALGSNGTVYAWGFGTNGELGNGMTTSTQTTPVAVSLPSGVTATAIAAGTVNGYALGSNGTPYAWGNGFGGELGNGTTSDPQTKPVAVSLPSGVTATAIGASEFTGFAIGSNGTLYAWGTGADGNLGNGTTTFPQTTPVVASLPAGVVPTAFGSGPQSETDYAVVRPAVTLSQGSLTSTTTSPGAGYSGQLTATNTPTGGGSLTWTTTNSSSEVTVSASGAVTVPTSVTTLGTVMVSGTVRDAVGDTGNWTFTLTVNGTPPIITSVNSATFTQGQSGTFIVTATGNPAPTFSGTGSLPIGVMLSDTGVLLGTPLQSGTFPITITASNGVSPNATQSFTLTVDGPPAITSTDTATFTEGQAGSFIVTATGTPAPYFTTSGPLPYGLFLSPGGVLSGTPIQTGSFPIFITADNGISGEVSQSFLLTVNASPIITSANSATFTQGQAGTFTFTATGLPAPTFSETGSLPNGVTLTSAGALSGTPSQSGTFPITITASNGVSPDATQSFTLTVNGTPPIITSVNSATFTQGQSGTFIVTATGNPAPTFSGTGSLPIGVMLSDTGVLLGTPLQSGTFPITITASNGVSPNATQSFTLTVDGPPAITSTDTATFTEGQAGSFIVTATGTPAPYFTTSGPLPYGLFLSPGGVLSGTPIQTGSFPIFITADNGISGEVSQSFLLTVNASPIITSANSATFTQGQAGTFTFTATGLPAPTFSETGSLPNGVTLTSAGALSGTPSQSGTFPITITASNGVSPDATQSFTLAVVSESSPPGGTITVGKATDLIGNYPEKVSGTSWAVHGDTTVTLNECASSAYGSNTCDAANQVTVTLGAGRAAGTFKNDLIHLVVGTIDTNGDTCGVAGSTTCYIVVVGNTGDSTTSAVLGFTAPNITLKKTTAVLGNYADAVKAAAFPIGDTVVALECDASVSAPSTVATHCDAATEITGTVASRGAVVFSPTEVTLRVGSAYSDGAGGTCPTGGTCDIVVTDSDNSAIGLSSAVAFASPTIAVHKTTAVLGNYVDGVKTTDFPIGDSVVAHECDSSVLVPRTVSTHCDAGTEITGTVAANGVVKFSPTGVTLRAGSAYSDGAGGACVAGGTCEVVFTDTDNAAVGSEVVVTFAAPTAIVHEASNVAANYVDHVTAGSFPVGDTVTAQECNANVAVANLGTNCDISTKITGTVASNGVVTFSAIGVKILVGGSYLDPALGTCLPGGTCDVVVNDSSDDGFYVAVPVGLAG